VCFASAATLARASRSSRATALSSAWTERQISRRASDRWSPTSTISLPPLVPLAHRATRRVAAWLALAITLAPRAAHAQGTSSATTSDVFRRFADRVVKIQVVESGSSAKSTIGSGFLASDDGQIVTNYHVISSVIATPGRYRTEVIDARGATRSAKVLAIDVVHDLAVLDAGMRGLPHFALEPVTLAQGNRLFSLGHPRDLGLSIVEGTHNGLLLHTLYPRIHLTGSLNPGMSGGPTIDDQGHVVGVNVSTAGNQVSFLVPVDRAIALLARVVAPGARLETPSLAQVGRQLREYQDVYLRDMFDSATKRIAFGPFLVMTQPAPFFRCWADASHEHEQAYERVWHRCATDNDIYLDEDQSSGSMTVVHQLVSTRMLNAPRFYALYSRLFGTDDAPSGDEAFVTSWECQTRNVRHERTTMRTSICMRRYRKLGELYDAVLKVAVLGRSDVGLVSTLSMTGVTFDNVERVSRRYLKLIAWR
jgi:serine protease Do